MALIQNRIFLGPGHKGLLDFRFSLFPLFAFFSEERHGGDNVCKAPSRKRVGVAGADPFAAKLLGFFRLQAVVPYDLIQPSGEKCS